MEIEDLLQEKFDIVIIGAGCIGSSIARNLSKYSALNVLILEKEDDISQGASKANSGIVHGGYDAKHGSLKGKFEYEGNQLFEQICTELSVPFKRVGSLVLSFTERDDNELDRLLENGMLNGLEDLEIWDRDTILQNEPHVSVGVRRALYCPHAGITNPYLYTIANCENAIANGVKLRLNSTVLKLNQIRGEYEIIVENTRNKNQFKIITKKVVNCAGLDSDMFQLSEEQSSQFQIKPRRGEYFILSREQGSLVNRVIFQAPTRQWGKGVLVSPTVDGNLLIGPSASNIVDKTDRRTTFQELGYVAWAARRSVPHLDTRYSIRSFAGIRAKSSTEDFVIHEKNGFVIVGGIDSPGLTSSPAIAKMVENLLKISSPIKSDWNPKREPYHINSMNYPKEELKFEHSNPDLNIVCRCETVTESTIKQCLKSGIELHCTDSVKWRTRAGMGPCQGFRCRPLVCEIMGKELGVDPTTIPKSVVGQTQQIRLMKSELGRL